MSTKNDFNARSFRDIMLEFESVTAQFDAIELDIEQALELHKKASTLLDELEGRLKKAEASVQKAAKA